MHRKPTHTSMNASHSDSRRNTAAAAEVSRTASASQADLFLRQG